MLFRSNKFGGITESIGYVRLRFSRDSIFDDLLKGAADHPVTSQRLACHAAVGLKGHGDTGRRAGSHRRTRLLPSPDRVPRWIGANRRDPFRSPRHQRRRSVLHHPRRAGEAHSLLAAGWDGSCGFTGRRSHQFGHHRMAYCAGRIGSFA